MALIPGLRMETRWRLARFEEVQMEIRTELENIRQEQGDRARLSYILARVDECSNSTDTRTSMRGYVYCMSALVHMQRVGGMELKRARKIAGIARAILITQGVKSGKSSLARLHGDIHYIMSQILLRQGLAFEAVWEQEIASRLSGRGVSGGEGFRLLSRGRRRLRIGDAGKATECLQEAESLLDPSTDLFIHARSSLVQALRLSLRHDECRSLIASGRELNQAPSFLQELSWEEAMLRFYSEQDPLPLVQMVARRSTHYQGSYLVETLLLSYAHGSMQWTGRLPKLSSLLKTRVVDRKETGPAVAVLEILRDVYDTGIPFETRLAMMGRLTHLAPATLTLSEEILAWMAASRWLLRFNCHEMAELTLGEYRSKNLRLSGGRDPDVLGLAGELFRSEAIG